MVTPSATTAGLLDPIVTYPFANREYFHDQSGDRLTLYQEAIKLTNPIIKNIMEVSGSFLIFQPGVITHLPPIESPNVASSHSEIWKKESESIERTGHKDRKNLM